VSSGEKIMEKQRTILVTFAGRRDRMELLTRYAGAALERGLIDEWHVWEFARNDADRRWLRQSFPVAQATPNDSLEYFRLPRPLSVRAAPERLPFSVRASHDAHLGLKRLSGAGPSFEIVLGGWSNQYSALRKFDDARALDDHTLRDPAKGPDMAVASPELLPEFGFSDLVVEAGPQGLMVVFQGAVLLHDPEPVAPGDFEILYRAGYGANGDWRFEQFAEHPARLFITGPEPHFPASALFYNRAYQYYAANADAYRNDVILKCDDDIVYFDLERLAEFVTFRRHNPQFFLVSTNVVNNGVCAHFQQAMGAIPAELMTCELPPGGMCGSLWSDGGKADALHRFFLMAPASFRRDAAAPIVFNERISINFIALLGADLVHIPDVSLDDEHDLCYGARKRARKQNCIYPQFLAAHLSFYSQDPHMAIAATLKSYEALADRDCAPVPRLAVAE
jgi:hypothetical protein